MTKAHWIVGTLFALGFAGVATDALAQAKPPAKPKARVEAATPNNADRANDWGPSGRRRSLELNGDGRWSLKLDYDQPTTRDVELRDMEAGAYFKLTPRVRVGGAVALRDQDAPRRVTDDEKPAPRVRLETTFRF